MRDILREVFDSYLERAGRPDEAYRRCQEESCAVWERAAEVLGAAQVNEMWCAQLQVTSLESYRCFLFGIRLGAALTELLAAEE